MEVLNHILPLEGSLKAFISLLQIENQSEPTWLLKVKLFYNNLPAGQTSFHLHGYSLDEAKHIALNLKENAFLMKEIDEYLWGESD